MASYNTKIAELEEKMAHLKWKKMCTQSRMKNVLQTSKKLHERDMVLRLGHNRADHKEEWMRGIIQDEMHKPLEVSDKYMKEFTAKKRQEDHHFRQSAKNHVQSIQRIKKKAQEREEMKVRKRIYHERVKSLYT